MAKFINLDVLDDEADNPMDDLFAHYERIKIELINSEDESSSIDKLEDVLTSLDRRLQDLEEKDSESSNFILNESKRILNIWSKAIEEKEDKSKIESSIYPNALQLLTAITHASKFDNVDKIETYFSEFLTRQKRIKNLAVDDKIEVDSLFQLAFDTENSSELKQIEEYLHENFSDLFDNYEVKSGELDQNYITDFEVYRECSIDETWDIELKLDDSENPEKMFFFLWTFIESLKKIDGIEVELDEIRQGSLLAKLKIKIKNLLAKEEVKQVLDNSVKSAQAFAEQKNTEVKKTKSETRKNESDKDLTDEQIKRLPDEEVLKEREKLKNKKMKAEIKSANLDNAKKQIDILKSLSDLTGKGIAEVDNLSIDINGLLYLDKRGEKIQTGADIQEIAEKSEN